MSIKLLVLTGVLFVSSSLLSIQRCSLGADKTAAYIEAKCEQTVDKALNELGGLNELVDITEADIDTILDKCMQDYENSPEHQASMDAFLHMGILMVISAVFGVAFVVQGISRFFSKAA